jgi:polysaccharide export outer membrane protein
MKQHTHNILKAVAFFSLLILVSCVPQKKILYFQDMDKDKDKDEEPQTEFVNQKAEDYRVQPGDNLYVRVRSIDQDAYSFDEARLTTNYYTEAGIYLNSYSVTDSGHIQFPLIGNIHVANKTLSEVQREIQFQVDEYIKNTVVIAKLVNFRVSMLGEFRNPGKYLVYQDDITIFQAISMAGDLTDFAERNEIVLIRQTESGSKMHRIDLNDVQILESDYFYLMPNDIIYAGPIKGKQFVFSQFPYALIISLITLGVVLYSTLQ